MDSCIFRAEDHATETLWDIVRDRENLSKPGGIGDCTLRRIAQGEAPEQYYFSALTLELIASQAAYELLRRLDPNQFTFLS